MEKRVLISVLFLLALAVSMSGAKKYKWVYNSKMPEVYTLAQGQQGKQIVKAWAVGGNANKAILQAKMDAVSAALFNGIMPDPSTHNMGTASLSNPLVTSAQYEENKELFNNFFKKGEFLNYVSDVNSSYPTGENNVAVKGGRKVGVNLNLDYAGLRRWLQDNGIIKGVGNHFKNE